MMAAIEKFTGKKRAGKVAGRLAGGIAFAFALALLSAAPSGAQIQGGGNGNGGGNGGGTPRQIQQQRMPDTALEGPIGNPVFQERRLRQLSIATHNSMVSDTDKLLELVTELSSEVGSTNPRSFTPDQLRKIAQIEKLAHSVKDKMRTTVQGPQDTMEAMPTLPRGQH